MSPAPTEFVLPVSPTAEVVAQEEFGRVLTGDAAAVRDRAMSLISGLLTSEDAPPAFRGDETIAVKVDPGPALGPDRRSRTPGRGWSWKDSGDRGNPRRGAGVPTSSAAIADRWGLVSGAQGAWVWFELDLPLGPDG